MRVRVFYPNKEGKIVFTKKELEKLLSEVYDEGTADGYSRGFNASKPVNITYPYTPYWYSTNPNKDYITCTDDSSTITTSGYVTVSNTLNNGIKIGDKE